VVCGLSLIRHQTLISVDAIIFVAAQLTARVSPVVSPVIVIIWPDPEYALNAADDATYTGAYDCSDWPGRLIPDGSPVGHASWNALSLRGQRQSYCDQKCRHHQYFLTQCTYLPLPHLAAINALS
jgi:hypothetical protein